MAHATENTEGGTDVFFFNWKGSGCLYTIRQHYSPYDTVCRTGPPPSEPTVTVGRDLRLHPRDHLTGTVSWQEAGDLRAWVRRAGSFRQALWGHWLWGDRRAEGPEGPQHRPRERGPHAPARRPLSPREASPALCVCSVCVCASTLADSCV